MESVSRFVSESMSFPPRCTVLGHQMLSDQCAPLMVAIGPY